MGEWWNGVLRCPVCGANVQREGNTLTCDGARQHCFDFASAGYVNLASAKAAGGGDDAALIAARSAFLDRGYYAPIADKLCALLQTHCRGKCVLDAGCGEGYYSTKMAKAGFDVLGLDLSKRGVLHAAKGAKREGISAFFAVAGIFELPVADASLDAVVSLFAPAAEAEFSRVLKPGGILVLAGAGARHLFSLKRVLYDTPYENEPRADAPTGMALIDEQHLCYAPSMPQDALAELFAMTPYYYRTSKQGQARLLQTAELAVDVDVSFSVYRK